MEHKNNTQDISYDKANNDNYSGDSFIENDAFQPDKEEEEEEEEREKSHMLSYQDVEILQNELREIFKKLGTNNINFHQFCEIIQNMVPSPETNDDIKLIFNSLDNNNNGSISYDSFLEPNIFYKFLQTIGFIILNKSKTINNKELENEMYKMHDKFYFRALSIHNTHDREIILSEAETIQKLKHWIDIYGKPSQLKCQNLQSQLENISLLFNTLKHENNQLIFELSQIKKQNEEFIFESKILKEEGHTLQQQVSLVNEEQKRYLSYSENKIIQLDTLQIKYKQSVTTQNDLIAQNDTLKQTNLHNVDQNIHIKRQLKDKDLFIKSLKIDKHNLTQKVEYLEKLIEQQQVDINLLESENTEQKQEIELLHNKTNGNYSDIGIHFRKTDAFEPMTYGGTSNIDGILDISTTTVNIQDDIWNTDNENTSPLVKGNNNGFEYKLFGQNSIETTNDSFYRRQINELKQQLLDETRKREELEKEIQLKMEQELKDSMIRRQSRSSSRINISHGRLSIDSIPLVIKEKNDDISSADELKPFIDDTEQNKMEIKSVSDNKMHKCCSFLFGM